MALGAFAIAGHKAAESMGEFARQIRDVQATTGMTVEEVQKMQIAAKLSGKDVDSVTQAMRGFTQMMEGTNAQAKKARQEFKDMGGDLLGLQYGTTSVYQAFEQIGEALKKNPDVFKNNAEMMDMLKRSGLSGHRDVQKHMAEA